MATDPRFLADSGREVFTGNELLVKGALETDGGVHLLTGYPGSPVAGFFDILGDIGDLLNAKGIRAFQANNEALAVAAVNGSQMAAVPRHRRIEKRRRARRLRCPGPGQSRRRASAGRRGHHHGRRSLVRQHAGSRRQPVPLRTPPHARRRTGIAAGSEGLDRSLLQAQSGGGPLHRLYRHRRPGRRRRHRRSAGPISSPPSTPTRRSPSTPQQIDLNKVLLPPRTWQKELLIPRALRHDHARRPRAGDQSDHSRHRSATRRNPSPLGFIVTGMGGPYLEHVLADLGLAGVFPILQMGMSYPADVALVARILRRCART